MAFESVGRVVAVGGLCVGLALGVFGVAAHLGAADDRSAADDQQQELDEVTAAADALEVELIEVDRRIEAVREARPPVGAANQAVEDLVVDLPMSIPSTVDGFNRAVALLDGGDTAAAVAVLESEVVPLLAETESQLGELPPALREIESAARALLRELGR